MSISVKQEFESGSIGWEILFIFIAGCMGDLAVHGLAELTKKSKFPFAQGLLPYYESLGDKLLILNTKGRSNKFKNVSGTVQGAIWGGIACVVALLIAKLFLYAKEETERS